MSVRIQAPTGCLSSEAKTTPGALNLKVRMCGGKEACQPQDQQQGSDSFSFVVVLVASTLVSLASLLLLFLCSTRLHILLQQIKKLRVHERHCRLPAEACTSPADSFDVRKRPSTCRGTTRNNYENHSDGVSESAGKRPSLRGDLEFGVLLQGVRRAASS